MEEIKIKKILQCPLVEEVICTPSTFSTEETINPYNLKVPDELKNAVQKRKTEYLSGRWCACKAIHNLTGRIEFVGYNKDRSPIWPKGIVGSISHTDEIVWCVVGQDCNFFNVGIDVEKLIADPIAEEIWKNIVTPAELSLLKSKFDLTRAITLAFSAKESIYKCYYKISKCFIDFFDIEITDIDIATKKIHYNLLSIKNLPDILKNGQVNYVLHKSSFYTFLLIPNHS